MLKITALLLMLAAALPAQEGKIITLTWDAVVNQSRQENLSLRIKKLQYEQQEYKLWDAYALFLPTVRYQAAGVSNLELPTIVFMGQQFTMGTKYTFQHSLDFTLPLFTGGSRYINLQLQKTLRKSMLEELKGKEEEVVLQALQAYFGVMLSEGIYKASAEAVITAEENLRQVQMFYDEGSATELDLQRAKAMYYSVLPQRESAASGKVLALQNLKMLLDIPAEDSVIVPDSLTVRDFMQAFDETALPEFRKLSLSSRAEVLMMQEQVHASREAENLVISSALPVIALSGNLAHQAFSDDSRIGPDDYSRSKALTLSISWPLFEGGRRFINYQNAQLQTEQAELLQKQTEYMITLETEQNYYKWQEAKTSLTSNEESMKQAKESLRLSHLLYAEGMSTQLDVLNAQLFYQNSRVQYLQGLYQYTVSQLNLLRSAGKLFTVWNNNER
ncbi:MAG: TolC family protein [Ignavibacteriaceae bacterium]|nr:TolC family protein [Ignavibacteriaceae bacterium]